VFEASIWSLCPAPRLKGIGRIFKVGLSSPLFYFWSNYIPEPFLSKPNFFQWWLLIDNKPDNLSKDFRRDWPILRHRGEKKRNEDKKYKFSQKKCGPSM
jgi:hypothetical protein